MIFSPLSETPSLGRNWIYIVTLLLYIAFTVGTAVAQNFDTLLALRFWQASWAHRHLQRVVRHFKICSAP